MSNPVNHRKVSRFLRPAVICFLWLVVMVVFFHKEIIPSLAGSSSSIPLLQAGLPDLVGDEWMVIFFNGRQTGYTHTVLYPYREEGFYGSALDSTIWLEVSFQGRTNQVHIHSFCLIAPGGEIERLNVSVKSAAPPFNLKARLEDNHLKVIASYGGKEKELTFPLPNPSLPLYALTPFFSLRPLREGESFSIPTLDPLASLSAGRPESGNIRFEVTEKTEDGYRLLAFYGGMTVDIRLDTTGKVLKIATPLGWMLVKQSSDEVMAYLENTEKYDKDR